jgi:hypothetical protein
LRGLRGLAVALVAVILISAVGFVSWNRWWRQAGPANPGFDCPTVVHAHHRVPFAAGSVHRVALIGDSIMVQASCAVAESLANVGIETSRHAIWGSGLLVGPDWVAETQKIMQSEKPDAVIAIFNGNYLFATVNDANGVPIEAGTPAFFRAWQARAKSLSEVVHAAHAEMYWVSPPPIIDPALKDTMRLFNGYRTIDGDHFLFSGKTLESPDGSLVMTKETCGHRRTIRSPEKIHLTKDGARIYGQQIAHDFTADIGILSTPKPC